MYSSNPCVQHIVPRIITAGFPKCKCVIRIKASDIAYNDSALQSHAGLLVQPNLDPLFLHYVLMITNLLAHNRLVIRSCVRKKVFMQQVLVHGKQHKLTFCKNRKIKLIGCVMTFMTLAEKSPILERADKGRSCQDIKKIEAIVAKISQ